MSAFDVEVVKRRLAEANGGYEIVHESEGLELGVYVLVAPEPDRHQPYEDDEVYIVLDGGAAFVPAGVEHRFSGYEQLSVLVIFEKRRS